MNNKDKNIFSLSLDIDFSSEQKISDLISKYNVRVLYLGENRNGSYFTKEVVDNMINTLGGVPVIGHYDAEKKDFLGHGDLRVIVTEEGEVETKKVGPVPYGFIPLNPRTWWEKHVDKDSVEAVYYEADPGLAGSNLTIKGLSEKSVYTITIKIEDAASKTISISCKLKQHVDPPKYSFEGAVNAAEM